MRHRLTLTLLSFALAALGLAACAANDEGAPTSTLAAVTSTLTVSVQASEATEPPPATSTSADTSITTTTLLPLLDPFMRTHDVLAGEYLAIGSTCVDQVDDSSRDEADLSVVSVGLDGDELVLEFAFDLDDGLTVVGAARRLEVGTNEHTIWIADPDGRILATLSTYPHGYPWIHTAGVGLSCELCTESHIVRDVTTTDHVVHRWSLNSLNTDLASLGLPTVNEDFTWFATTGSYRNGTGYYDRCPDL